MKATFNRTAYAQNIKNALRQGVSAQEPLFSDSFSTEDYSAHIRATAGKVLECSVEWYK